MNQVNTAVVATEEIILNTKPTETNGVKITNGGVTIPNYTTEELNEFALNKLGVLYSAPWNEGPFDTNNIISLIGGWNAKWFKITSGYVLKLVANDKDKRFLLDRGMIRYFISIGFSKFVSIALLKARIKYKIELALNLKAIMSNDMYLQAFKFHPFYVAFDTTNTDHPNYENKFKKLRESWYERWGEIFEKGLLNITLKQECEIVKMIKTVEAAKILFLKKEAEKANKPEEVKSVKKEVV